MIWEEQELEDLERKIDPQIKTLLLASIALALTIWDIAFNLGAFGTVFFSDFFWVWVTATVTLLIIRLTLRDQSLIRWQGGVILLAPTLILVCEALVTVVSGRDEVNDVISIISLVIAVICLPYTIYIVSIITNESLLEVKNKDYRRYLIMIAVVVALVGFGVGRFNFLFLSCEDFKVSGNDLPANCRQVDTTIVVDAITMVDTK